MLNGSSLANRLKACISRFSIFVTFGFVSEVFPSNALTQLIQLFLPIGSVLPKPALPFSPCDNWSTCITNLPTSNSLSSGSTTEYRISDNGDFFCDRMVSSMCFSSFSRSIAFRYTSHASSMSSTVLVLSNPSMRYLPSLVLLMLNISTVFSISLDFLGLATTNSESSNLPKPSASEISERYFSVSNLIS